MPLSPGLKFAAVLLLFLALPILFSGCLQSGSPGSPTALGDVQVSEYKGEKLSAISDMQENSIKGPQHINISSYSLRITGLVESPENYTYNAILEGFQHYSKVVTLNCVEGWSVTLLWEGVKVQDLFNEAKPTKAAKTVIFHAIDGYTSSFPIDYFSGRDILMAYKINNVTLPDERGFPFMLVAESKWGYKWVKWIDGIEFSPDENYRGYWESNGYSNSGNLNESFFG